MNDWTFKDLEIYDDKICDIARGYGLDWFPINYEVCDYYEMIGHMSYHGLPSHYPHWSYGKSFERTHQLYNLGAEGLPYELIINSDPSIAYLMRENALYLQVLIMAHCVGHSDFFKNNRMFKNTRPQNVVTKFRNARKRIQGYVEDPSIGLRDVEKTLDAAHAIKFQIDRNGKKRRSHNEIRKELLKKIKNDKKGKYNNVDVNKVPLERDYDILGFICEFGIHLDDWQRDILEIVRDESTYFMPQIQTKILNEGWASFWHYKIMHDLDLSSELHLPFLKSHNQVIRPHIGNINPYHVGFKLFKKIEKEKGLDECFLIREVHDDVSAIRCYLDEEMCEEMNLFSYSSKKDKVTIDEIADEDGCKKIKNDLINNVGTESIPRVYVDTLTNGVLALQHELDGRELELEYADSVVNHIRFLWNNEVKLFTEIEDELWEV